MRKKKLKPIQVDLATYKLMERIWGPGKVPYNPTIIEKGGEKEKDGSD